MRRTNFVSASETQFEVSQKCFLVVEVEQESGETTRARQPWRHRQGGGAHRPGSVGATFVVAWMTDNAHAARQLWGGDGLKGFENPKAMIV